MSQTKLKENNMDTNSNKRNGIDEVERGNDLNARKAALTPLEFRVTQQRETERPFSNKYNRHWEAGTYHCVVCDADLFQSETKFESKSGWPAFYNVVDPRKVTLKADLSHIGANLLLLVAKPDLARTEVSCANCNAHLGHLFKDGPKPTGLRYCINSAALSFKSDSGEISSNGGLSPMSISNGNDSNPANFTEYACNPENTCSRPQSVATTPATPASIASTPNTEFRGKSARDQFFSSTENSSLPPMGTLCLNNQACQRIAPSPTKPAPVTDDAKKPPRPNFISNGAENRVSGNKSFASSTTNGTSTASPKSNMISSSVSTPRSKIPFSRGASLTAARINFFQKISAKQDSTTSPSKWAVTFNSKWSSNKSSSPLASNNSIENHNGTGVSASVISVASINPATRFPSSCSSGSLSTVLQQPKMDESPSILPRRSSSSIFSSKSSSLFPSPTVSVERISTPPRAVALRETNL